MELRDASSAALLPAVVCFGAISFLDPGVQERCVRPPSGELLPRVVLTSMEHAKSDWSTI